jgi:hypothetical protein
MNISSIIYATAGYFLPPDITLPLDGQVVISSATG